MLLSFGASSAGWVELSLGLDQSCHLVPLCCLLLGLSSCVHSSQIALAAGRPYQAWSGRSSEPCYLEPCRSVSDRSHICGWTSPCQPLLSSQLRPVWLAVAVALSACRISCIYGVAGSTSLCRRLRYRTSQTCQCFWRTQCERFLKPPSYGLTAAELQLPVQAGLQCTSEHRMD